MPNKEQQSQSEVPEKALTSIRGRIHGVATQDTSDGVDELDRIEIDNFLDTLAEIAMAIAKRKEQREE